MYLFETWQGLVINGITYWIQVWAIEKKGPVFTAIFTPFALIITAIFSAFLWKETLHWGRSIHNLFFNEQNHTHTHTQINVYIYKYTVYISKCEFEIDGAI